MVRRIFYSILLITLASSYVKIYCARPEPENLPDPRTRTYPCVQWAKNYEGGIPRVLFIAPNQSAWDIYELAMRMDLNYDVFYTIRPGSFAPTTDYYHEGIKLYPELKKELAKLFEEKWDVITFVDEDPYNLPPELHYKLIEKIISGTSVVCFNKNRWNVNWNTYPGVKEYQEISFFNTIPTSAFTVLKTITFEKRKIDQKGEVLPSTFEMEEVPYEVKPVTVITIGKGKIFTFIPGGDTYFGGPGIHPAQNQSPEEIIQNEYFFSLAAKLILTAANLLPSVKIKKISFIKNTFSPGENIVGNIDVDSQTNGVVEIIVRSSLGEIVYKHQFPCKLNKNTQTIDLNIPGLDAGRYYLDVWIKKADRKQKTVDWASAYFIVKHPEIYIKSLFIPSLSFNHGEKLRAIVKISSISSDIKVSTNIQDVNNRILEKGPDIIPASDEIEITLPLDRTREIYNRIEVLLVKDGRILDRKSKHFYVPRKQEKDLIVWTDGEGLNLVGKRRREIYREYGITTVEINNNARSVVVDGLDIGTRYWLTHCTTETGGCISSPTYSAALAETFRHVTKLLLPYGGKFISTGDDSGVANDFCNCPPYWVRSVIVKFAEKYNGDHRKFALDHNIRGWGDFRYMAWQASLTDILNLKLLPGEFDLFLESWKENYKTIEDFNRASGTNFKSWDEITQNDLHKIKHINPCLLGFRDELNRKYKSIEVLNSAWKSSFSSFEDITDEEIQKLKQQGKYGGQLDKIWYLEDLFIKNMEAASRGVKEVSNEIGVGQGAASFGNIIPEVLQFLDSAIPYEGARDLEVIRSVPHRYCGHTIGVYGGKAVSSAVRENQPWHVLFTGGNFIWFWSMITGGLDGDLSMNPNRSGIMLKNIQEMQKGVARALIQSERQHDGIAILHSRRSGELSGILKTMGTVFSSEIAFQNIIEDLGMQYRYTWTDEIERGILRTGEFKVLILPYAQIVSEREILEIKNFVKQGGMVIADLRTGTHDWYGNPLENGALDEIFGVKISGSDISPLSGTMVWHTDLSGTPFEKPGSITGIHCDGSVKQEKAISLCSIGNSPCVFINRYGNGTAIFLNFSPTSYNFLLNRNEADTLRNLYRKIFILGGVERKFKVLSKKGEDVKGVETAIFKNGDITYLTIEKHPLEFEKYPIPGYIFLNRNYEAYDLRKMKKIGWTDRIPVEFTGLGCYVYSLLPYKVKDIRVQMNSRFKKGDDVKIEVEVLSDNNKAGSHTVRIDVFNPSGKRLWPMLKKETVNGKVAVDIPLAYNEQAGKWKVVVTDVSTGLTKTLFFTVEN